MCTHHNAPQPKKRSHIKVKSKISYLGKRNSILPGQMAEQLAVEVDVKKHDVWSTQQQQQEEQDKPQYLSWMVYLHLKHWFCATLWL